MDSNETFFQGTIHELKKNDSKPDDPPQTFPETLMKIPSKNLPTIRLKISFQKLLLEFNLDFSEILAVFFNLNSIMETFINFHMNFSQISPRNRFPEENSAETKQIPGRVL